VAGYSCGELARRSDRQGYGGGRPIPNGSDRASGSGLGQRKTNMLRRSATMTTNDMMTLHALLGEISDADLLRETISFTAEHPMALGHGGMTAAAHGE